MSFVSSVLGALERAFQPTPEEALQQKWVQMVKPKVGLNWQEISERQESDIVSSVLTSVKDAFSSLQAFAQQIVAPQTLSTSSQNPYPSWDSLKKIYADYNFGRHIAQIQKWRSEGKTVCGYIGRTPFEALPKAKENEVWISLDAILQPYYTAMVDTTILDPNRIFLLLDCNQQEGLGLAQGLFDLIVIGTSTTKFFDNDFAKRFSVLLHDEQGAMFFPSAGQISMPMEPVDDHLSTENGYCFITSFFSVMKDHKKLETENPHFDSKQIFEAADALNWQKADEFIKNHLATLFDKVKMGKGPYPELFIEGSVTCFAVSGKKG